MKILLFLSLFLTGCMGDDEIRVYRANDSNWVCRASIKGKEYFFDFSGDDKENRAHKRCDSFLPFLNKLDINPKLEQ